VEKKERKKEGKNKDDEDQTKPTGSTSTKIKKGPNLKKNLMQGPPLALSDGQDKKEEGKKGRRKKIRSSFERYLNELNYHITHIKNTPKKESGPPPKKHGYSNSFS